MIDPNAPAFPKGWMGSEGISIRAHFASLAMQGLCANRDYTDTPPFQMAGEAVAITDALIAELNKAQS